MASSKKDEIISEASPHTIKKFELIEAYTIAWARALLGYSECDGIVFIDCMSNSGLYYREGTHELVEGTPIRVARALESIMREPMYRGKQAWLYFNDMSRAKIDELRKHLPPNQENFFIETSYINGNDLIRDIGGRLGKGLRFNYLLVYDPYQATIDWNALLPFIRNWGEVIINHMVSDTLRAAAQAKRPETIIKYESTYLSDIADLVKYGTDKDVLEDRIKKIIMYLKGSKNGSYYIASYPFFNSRNTVVYHLMHCTTNMKGFKLFKTTAWKTFGGKSSMKRTHNVPGQIQLNLLDDGQLDYTSATDENCFYISDIAQYLEEQFAGRQGVQLDEMWNLLDESPVFPSDGFKDQIKRELEARGHKKHISTFDFI